MKKVYLILTILAFALNLTTMWNETFNEGNILLWTNPDRTTALAFANDISSIFMYDLFYVVIVFTIWLLVDSKRKQIKKPWVTIAIIWIFGLAVGFPYYLYLRESKKGMTNERVTNDELEL